MPDSKTQHTTFVSNGSRVEALKRRVYRLAVKGRGQPTRKCVEDTVTIGSHEGNSLVVEHATVSRFHARIELDPNGFLLTDLDSTNGTFVNGMRVKSVYLEPRAKISLGRAELTFDLEREEVDLGLSKGDQFGALYGASPPMRRLFDELERVSAADTTLLLQGETGTGKDLVAQEIHQHSARRAEPFVVVDCGGMPENLIESELFGHERGAFTGADKTRAGAFETAHRGTLFLDEIAELPLQTQSKLLRVLESKTVKRIGSNDWRKVDVRVIAATHKDLALLCNQRLFREDLYFRLAVITLRLPPLRDRLEDLPALVHRIVEELGPGPSVILDERLLGALKGRRWAGNVRELRNVIQRASLLGLDALSDDGATAETNKPTGEPFKSAKARAVEEFERGYLVDLLTEWKGNVARAARAAEVDPAWIFRLVKRHGIDVNALRRG